MIAYGASVARQAAIRASLGNPPARPATAPPMPAMHVRPPRLTRAQFIAREAADKIVPTTATDDGVIRWGIRYLAMPCYVEHEHNPGWVLVRHDPGAIAHYERLFGRSRPMLPSMPGPVQAGGALGIPCPGCGALCDGSAVGDHEPDCPLYGEDAPDGPDWPDDAP